MVGRELMLLGKIMKWRKPGEVKVGAEYVQKTVAAHSIFISAGISLFDVELVQLALTRRLDSAKGLVVQFAHVEDARATDSLNGN